MNVVDIEPTTRRSAIAPFAAYGGFFCLLLEGSVGQCSADECAGGPASDAAYYLRALRRDIQAPDECLCWVEIIQSFSTSRVGA